MAPGCFFLLGYLLVLALLQDGDGDKLLHVLSLVTGQQVGSHSTHITTFLVVGFMITPPKGHGFLGRVSGGGHPYVMNSHTLRSS